MPPPPPPPEELEEEVLLRFPPLEPALLVRASLVCKRWRRLVRSPGFWRRFRELHRTPSMLGFLGNIMFGLEGVVADLMGAQPARQSACFVPTADGFRLPDADIRLCRGLDARHGRVLLQRRGVPGSFLMVWDLITGDKHQVPSPLVQHDMVRWTAAVLCAAGGRCDHLRCHRGPFLVVCAGYVSGEAVICTYSSDAGTWSDPIATEQPLQCLNLMPSVLVGNALYFGCLASKTFLKYDLESHEMSVNRLPFTYCLWRLVVLDSGLGLATVHESKLCLWKKTGPEVDAGWTEDRVIELETLLPSDAFLTSPDVVGFADGIDVIFLRAGSVLYTIDTKTDKVKKVYEGERFNSVIPYMSFFAPALGSISTGEGPGVGASST
ncbi:uncharacterized protein C2845_PM03G18300 [Panicum miliaceum]|uniref:Uncharacterized protein n=1 Tax=Panicum miliaceum TaxID=4540 RepID=A0A3L6T3Q4_PANMI|nr:uncharacterized protein C2845_PM03G18300 [Panicum miliaceum]